MGGTSCTIWLLILPLTMIVRKGTACYKPCCMATHITLRQLQPTCMVTHIALRQQVFMGRQVVMGRQA